MTVSGSLKTGIRSVWSDVCKSEKSSGFKIDESEKFKSASLKAGAGSVCNSAVLFFGLVWGLVWGLGAAGLSVFDFRELPTCKFSACFCGTISSFSLENPWAFILLATSHR